MSDPLLEPAGRPSCLVLMPMYAGFERIRAEVAQALWLGGFEIVRLETEIPDSSWHLWLLDALDRCDVALVDLTHHNPFVTYELGCVHQRRLPVALMLDAREPRLPATVRGAACALYGAGRRHFAEDVIDDLRQLHFTRTQAQGIASPAAASRELYRTAVWTSDAFIHATGLDLVRVDEPEFRARVTVAERRGAPDPRLLAGHTATRVLLSLVLQDSDRVDVMAAICDWGRASFDMPTAANASHGDLAWQARTAPSM